MSESERQSRALDAAMVEAFRDAATGGVLDQLGAGASKILLREPPSDAPSPLLKPIDGGRTGRYQVLGEIARGGVGVVMKGHDVDLGRDVAMKVLRDEHSANPEVVQRFVEEAQIGGQLQHPGIVPVYELGVRADRRPWFSMKLVKGRTLSALLADRKDLAQDRRRFVGVFEQVCQTMAYAHSRGVIHRDLKPSNVMVGAFGEVQVVDWGLAKVMRHGGVADERRARKAPADVSVIATVRSESAGSESVVGSLLGTPAYMPPEQARGMVDQLDEKSDVFSLGAVLCEILTGKPPYVGEASQLLAMAAKCELADAYDRLDACGADEELLAIARSCLIPAREVRPANAGEVARMVGEHLASIEQRIGAAQVEAAAARAREEEAAARAEVEREKRRQEQRAKRMTLALAGVVLVAVVGGGFAWRSAELSRIDREHAAEARFASAMDEADLLRRRAESGQNLRFWDEAEAAATRADAAVGPDLPSESRERLAAFHASFDRALANERAAASAFSRGIDLRRARDFEGAMSEFRDAIKLMPRHVEFRNYLAYELYRTNRPRECVREWQAIVDVDPLRGESWGGLARAAARHCEFERGLAAAQRQIDLDPSSAGGWESLGAVRFAMRDWDGAAAAWTEALDRDPGNQSVSTSRRIAGENKAKRSQVMPRVEALIRGEASATAAEWLGNFVAMTTDGRFADAVRLAEKWMALDPVGADKVWECGRYNAACAAARAGAGEGRFTQPIDDAAKAEFRARARKWLTADVAEWNRLFEAAGNVPSTDMIKNLSWAKEDGDLSPIRDEEFTSKWPEDERKACAALWTELDAVLAKAKAAAPVSK
jgi:tetratricopeptide (TPR) repeat protein/tRNA A-37 threonylcarbamoyl transferase component Bud32